MAIVLPFSLKDEFDLSTFRGRFQMNFATLNPLLYYKTNAQIVAAIEVMSKYKGLQAAANGQTLMMTQEHIDEVKYASKIVGGAVHPETDEIIPFLMRMSGFVSFNIPILAMMLFTPNQTPVFNAVLQLVNQTYNAGLNYGNRNTSITYTASDLGRGYLGAVVASMGIAYGTRTMLAPKIAKLKGGRNLLA